MNSIEDDFLTRKKVTIQFDALAYLRQFNFNDLFPWLQVTLCHPHNQLFSNRIIFLIAQVLSIAPEEFIGNKFSEKELAYLFEATKTDYDELFFMADDFEGFSQYDLIPFFFKKNRYYVCYSNLERPIELWKEFADTYFESEQSPFSHFKIDFINSLSFQTKLLEKMVALERPEKPENKVFIPTQSIHDELAPIFKIAFPVSDSLTAGAFSKLTFQELFDKSCNGDLYKEHLFVSHGPDNFWLFPHSHIPFFIENSLRQLKESPDSRKWVQQSFRQRLHKSCLQFFDARHEISVLKSSPDGVNHSNEICYAVLVDSNKLFLFKDCDISLTEDITKSFEAATAKMEDIALKIKGQPLVYLVDNAVQIEYCVPSKDLEIWLIPCVLPTTFNISAGLNPPNHENISVQYLSFTDLRAIFDLLEDALDLVKFLKEDKKIKSRTDQNFMGEFMDRFSFYVENGHSYLRSARQVSFFMFEPHMWHFHYHSELFKLARHEDFLLEIERNGKNVFNYTEKIDDKVFQVTETAMLSSAYVIKLAEHFVWIFLPDSSIYLSKQDFVTAYSVLGILYKDYLLKFENHLESLLAPLWLRGISYSIMLQPKSRVMGNASWENIFEEALDKHIDEPITCITKFRGDEARTFITYDPDLCEQILNGSTNSGERLCMERLLLSIAICLGNDSETVNETIKAAVEKYLPLGIKRYSIEALEVRNPKLDNYHFPIDFNETDMAVTETLMSNYLISNNIEPGTYTGENAKNIFEKIYNYLQDFLEMEISKYDSGILYFIYRQMELAEGTRYTEKIRLGMKAKGNVDYDLRDDYQKQDIEQTTLLLTIRHILHSFLKVEISTKTRITKERWTYLLALAKTVLDAGYLYEFLDYSLLDHEVEVSPDYLIRPKSTGGRFDSFKYRQKETEETIKHAVNDIERKSTVKRENEIEEFNKELNQVFTSEFGFSYNDLIFVLTALSISSFSSGYFPPIVIASVNELIKLIQDSDFQHIPEDEIRRIIEYLSLKKGIYSKSTFLHQTNMMRFKERITLCPLIHDGAGNIVYGNQACYNAANIWAAAASGHFPFVINVSTAIQEVIRKIHREEDLKLEGQASQQAIEILGRQNVESQISNFRRLSKNFRKDPACGEIDILCVNATTKIIFVLDVKNTLRRLNAYYAKNSLREFFEGNSSYHKKLLKKKDFVQGNLSEILLHFKINSSDGWIVKEAFITDKLIFAGFHSDNPVDFILLNELSTYLIK